ncbi:MAG: hypothetical protein IRY94_00290 [Rhodospirillaceae bacterium]|nr:hypothetical protein [Rhodospirillaceae bacterium]
MSLSLTLALFGAAAALFALATLLARRPPHPGRVWLIPPGAVQFVCLLLMLATAAHLVSLLTGRPFTGRGGW